MTGKKLLVADDSLTIQKVIRLALSSDGYDIQAVSDGNDALGQISMIRPDIVLIDVSLPGQNAFELKRLVNTKPDLASIPFVLMSSAFEKVDENQAAEVQFSGRLTKPFDPAHLREVIRKALDSSPRRELDASMENLPILPDPEQEMVSEDWMKTPIEPIEPVIAAPSHIPNVSQLWENEPKIAPTPPAASRDNDIKNLTETTIRMSGLNDFEWSVSEPSLKPPSAEPLTPPPSHAPHSAEPILPPSLSLEEDEIEIPSMDDLPELPAEDESFSLDPEQLYVDSSEAPIVPPAPPSALSSPASSLSSEQMEALIRQELAKILPDLAEKMIKEEIHRMLTEA